MSFASFVKEMREEHAYVQPLMVKHGVQAVKIMAQDAKPRRTSRDNIPSQWQGGFSKMTQPGQGGSDSFSDKYEAKDSEIVGGAPRYEWHGQQNVEGDDLDEGAHQRLMQFLASKGLSEEDCAQACQIAGAGEMSTDDLPTGAHRTTDSPPVGTSGRPQYSRADTPQNYYSGADYEAYDPVGNARSPTALAGDDPENLPGGGMPQTGGRLTNFKHISGDSRLTPAERVTEAVYHRVITRALGQDGKVPELPTRREIFQRNYGVDLTSVSGQRSDRQNRVTIAQDAARKGAHYGASRDAFLKRNPGASRLGGI
jgi:hypothetical protein